MACGGPKLRFVNSTKKLSHLTLLSIHLVIDLLLFGLLGVKAALFGPMFLRHSFGVGRKLFPFEITAVVRLLNGFHVEGAAGLGGLFGGVEIFVLKKAFRGGGVDGGVVAGGAGWSIELIVVPGE